jgi:NADP-dependent 3-hydroxy acid dehydrogenase YdfG
MIYIELGRGVNMKHASLKNKVAIVTGATSGIGLAIAQELHNHGVKVVLSGRNEDALIKISKELCCVYVVGDLTETGIPERLINTALSQYKRCDFVINSAGIIEVGDIKTIDIDKISQMVDININAAFRLSYLSVRHFLSQNSGYLINISSVMGTKTRPTAGAYSGTKFAIEALSESLRMELANTPIGVTCIEPGLVMTNLHKEWEVHPSKSMGIENPLLPSDVANCVIFALTQPSHVKIPKLMILPEGHEI